MQRIKTYACEDCGELTTRRYRVDKPRICLPCGERRLIETAYLQKAAKGLDRAGYLAMVTRPRAGANG